MTEATRKLASIRKIFEINSIPDASNIEVATVDLNTGLIEFIQEESKVEGFL